MTAAPAEVPDKTPLPTTPALDPQGLAKFMAAGMGKGDPGHNAAAMGGGDFTLSQKVALGSGATKGNRKSIFDKVTS